MLAAIEKAKNIQLLILDVDGILTTGALYYGNAGFEMRGFHIHDGLGIKLLQQTGVKIAIISGKNSEAVTRRMQELNINHVYLGHEDKLPVYHDLKKKLNLDDSQIAYMGDDLPDLPLLIHAGLAITVPQAPDIIKQHVDFVTTKKGGKGAVREVCELIMESQDQLTTILQYYLTQ